MYADSIVVIVHDNPQVHLIDDTTICDGEKIILHASSSGSYTWNTNEYSSEIEIHEPGLYSLETENAYGCKGADSMYLFVQDLPIVELGNDTTICRGESILFDTKNIGLIHDWNTGDSSHQITINYEGMYHVTITDYVGCSKTDSIELFVNELPNLHLGNDTSICEGESIHLTTGHVGLQHAWNTSQTTNSIVVISNGIYSVVVSDSIGCSNSDSIQISVNQLPIVSIGNDTSICDGESVELKTENIEDIKKKTEALVQASMKLGEAIYKSQQNTKPESNKDDGDDNKGKKDDNVVDADFEEVKDENKEKSA